MQPRGTLARLRGARALNGQPVDERRPSTSPASPSACARRLLVITFPALPQRVPTGNLALLTSQDTGYWTVNKWRAAAAVRQADAPPPAGRKPAVRVRGIPGGSHRAPNWRR